MIMWGIIKEICVAIAGVFGFAIAVWKSYGKKWWYHYKENRNQWRISLMDIQKEQNANIEKIIYQLYPNGGKNAIGKIDKLSETMEKVLDNQVIIRETHVASLYLDETPTVKSDMNGLCTFANLAYLKMFGFNDAAQALGEGALRSIHPDDRERIMHQYISALKSGTQFVSTYRKINVSTGQVFNVMSMTKIINNSKGEHIEAIGVIRVINSDI